MNKVRTTAGVFAAAALLALGWIAFRSTTAPAPAAEPPPAAPITAHNAPAVIGAVGCSGVACHGRPIDGLIPASGWGTAAKDRDRWRSSYTAWRTYDPHAGAFEALKGDLSQQIERRLGTPGDAAADARCLACHANPALADRPQPRELLADGVSCEACHGNAGPWVGDHAGWPAGPGHADRYGPAGMTRLSDPAVRAGKCAGCHVGAPGRDVNHDLIAAGHPRLNFDYATYLRALPPHWAEKDREASPPALRPAADEFRHWLVGRAAISAAGYRLLAERAERGPWPELAAFDCYACHHGLTGVRKDPPRILLPRPGALAWNDPPLAARLSGPEFGDLRAALSRPLDVEHVRTHAGRAADHWRRLAGRWAAEPLQPADVALLLAGAKPRRWDEACHLYYAVLAIDRARAPRPPQPEPPELARVRAILQLPRTADGVRFNSPADLPADELAGLFANLFRARSQRD